MKSIDKIIVWSAIVSISSIVLYYSLIFSVLYFLGEETKFAPHVVFLPIAYASFALNTILSPIGIFRAFKNLINGNKRLGAKLFICSIPGPLIVVATIMAISTIHF